MPSYTVPINGPNGPGFMTVNASSPQAAAENASQGGNYATGGAQEGGHQAHTDSGGTATAGYPSGTPAPTTVSNTNSSVQQLGQQVNSLLGAIASGNKEAFQEAVRQFDLSFGLDKDKFTEAVRQFNQNYLISESGVTGSYQGNPTMQAIGQRQQQQQGWAQLYGFAPQLDAAGNPVAPTGQTLAGNQQAYAQQLGAITTAAGLQANPFRQAQVMGQLGGLLRGNPVAGFQAPGQAQGQTDFSGMGNMQRLVDDIRGGPGAINGTSTQGVLDAMPTPAKLNSVDFYRSSPGTQNIVLQGMQEKYGLSPDESLAQIKNTLPQFSSPTTFGTVKR